jgi:hypothetical protein
VGVHNVGLTVSASDTRMTIPLGEGYASITTDAPKLVAKVAGMDSIGYPFTCTAPVGPTGQTLVYFAYVTKSGTTTTTGGTLHGVAVIQGTADPHRVNTSSALTWSRKVQPASETRFNKGWTPVINLDVAGGLWTSAAVTKSLLGISGVPVPTVNNASVTFDDGGLGTANGGLSSPIHSPTIRADIAAMLIVPGSAIKVTIPVANNPGTVKLAFVAASGLFSGESFVLDQVARRRGIINGLTVPTVGVPSATNAAHWRTAGHVRMRKLVSSTVDTTNPVAATWPWISAKVIIQKLP